jgi:hypothetical protein
MANIQQRGTIKRSFNILEVYAESLETSLKSMQNHSKSTICINEVNVRLRKLTKYYGYFEIIQQEIENAATTDDEAEQEYRKRELLNEKYFFIEAAF